VTRRLRSLLVLVALAPLLALGPAPAHAEGAQSQGWWWVLHRSALPAPPAPPDVGAADLLLQGGDLARAVVPDTAPAPTALAALRFTTPPGASVGALVLSVATGAQAADVRAYPSLGTWAPAQGGAIEQAPQPDLSRFAPGFLSADGGQLVFPEAGALTGEDGVLSVVLVAGVADRVVVHHPSAGALAVTEAPAPPPSQPDPLPPPPQPGAALPPVSAPAPLPVVQPAPTTAAAPVPPVVAAAPAVSAQVGAKRVLADDRRTRLVVLLEALLLLGFFGLLGQGPLSALGRRLGTSDPVTVERGVGRFRRERVGAAPRL
jgi:hypothetical protein